MNVVYNINTGYRSELVPPDGNSRYALCHQNLFLTEITQPGDSRLNDTSLHVDICVSVYPQQRRLFELHFPVGIFGNYIYYAATT